MNCAPNVTNLVLFAKIKGCIIAQNVEDYNYEALIIGGRYALECPMNQT